MTQPTSKPTGFSYTSDDDLYRHTSQYRLWSMTPEELEKKRRGAYDRAATATRQKLDEKGISRSTNDALSYEEEQLLILTFSSKIPSLTEAMQLPTQVKATALSFFRKFYLVHSTMEHHPKNILFTCVFLAAKAENRLVSIERFCSHLSKVQPSDILDCEFLVLESLSFTLMVMNGYRPLRGLFLDIQSVLPHISSTELFRLRDDAREAIIKSFFSDVEFHFTPPQIAMAGLLIARENIMMEYLQKKFSDASIGSLRKSSKTIDSKGVDNLSTLLSILNECKSQMLSSPKPPTINEARALEKKLYYCRNPEKLLNAKRKLERRTEDPNGTPLPPTPTLEGQIEDEGPKKKPRLE